MSENSKGLYFCYYERRSEEDYPHYWSELSISANRLLFLRGEFEAISGLSDISQSLEQLEYTMENYLARIYELRERAAKLLKICGEHRGNIGQLKARDKRCDTVFSLSIERGAKLRYLELLSILDDDIALRNENIHDTFLKLGYWNGLDIFNPHDMILESKSRDDAKLARSKLRGIISSELSRTVQHYCDKIDTIINISIRLLEHLDSVERSL